jgi:hypothetical protein
MVCESCRKPVKEFEEFVLVGKYPTRGQMWKWSNNEYARPENYGKIFHRNCFSEVQKKESLKL